MQYENADDRAKESFVALAIQQHLERLPVGRPEVSRTTTGFTSHDLDVYVSGMYVGVVEVKSRNYPTSFFEENGWAFEVERLSALRSEFFNQSFGDWVKEVCLALLTEDLDIFLISIRTLVDHWDELMPAPEGFAKDNHGESDRADKSGVIIPLSLMTKIT